MAEIEEWRRLRWDGSNAAQLDDFTVGGFRVVGPRDRIEDPEITGEVWDKLRSTWAGVRTGQFVVCGVLGEFYVLDEEEPAADFGPTSLASLPVPEALAAGSRHLAEISEAVLGRLGVKPDGRPGVSFERDDSARITITWSGPPEGTGCKCYRGPLTHEHDSDEEGDCLVCGCGRYQAREPKEAG
jgi:hypothetical protein